MAPRFPPQSRMPTLLPQKTDVLWYPRERDVEHMHDELSHEEKEFTAKVCICMSTNQPTKKKKGETP